MYRSHITGSNVTRFFANSSRKKRAVNVPCSCHGNQNSASVLAMDLSQDGHTEVIFVDEDNNIVASDVYGCHCRTLLTTSPRDPKGMFTMSPVGRKPAYDFSDQVGFEAACTALGASKRHEIWDNRNEEYSF